MNSNQPRFRLFALLSCCLLPALTGFTATMSGHYPVGVEGLKGPSLPPPGIYVRDYNLFYYADEFADGPSDFRGFVYAQVPRVIWITELNVLGANYGLDLMVPFYYADLQFDTPGGRFKDETFSMGDLAFEPVLLSWHLGQFDLAAAYAFWAPTGDADKDGSRPARVLSRGHWTHMFTAGATWFIDKEKTWAASALNRYEIHTETEDKHFTAGDTWTIEAGFSKALSKTIDVGVIGYYQKQVTGYSGRLAPDIMDHVAGVGPEVSLFCPKLKLAASLRYAHEFEARQRPEGHTIMLTLTKPF